MCEWVEISTCYQDLQFVEHGLAGCFFAGFNKKLAWISNDAKLICVWRKRGREREREIAANRE